MKQLIPFMNRFRVFEVLLLLLVTVFFYPFFIGGNIPLPADTIVGMYHPWRDVVWDGYTAGVPYKNYLITDPVRQQYVWREFAIDELRQGRLPLWNPYSFSGTPLLATLQGAVLYPLNLFFFFIAFPYAWGILVVIQLFGSALFFYWYVRYMGYSRPASMIGAIAWTFSGFSIAWLEWNTILHVSMWMPLILLLQEKLLKHFQIRWLVLLILVGSAQVLAGHLQVLLYSWIITNTYLFVRIYQYARRMRGPTILHWFRLYIPFLFAVLLIALLTFIQSWPTAEFIQYSARMVDQSSYTAEGWFIPWQHLVQFIAPDFFGNPATANYWGIWNYGEFIGYIGILPLLLAIYSLWTRTDRKVLYFGMLACLSLLFSLPTPLAELPFRLKIPFISTSQPTRLLFILDFSLAVLATIGCEKLLREKRIYPLISVVLCLSMCYLGGWLFTFQPQLFSSSVTIETVRVAMKNLILPTAMFVLSVGILLMYIFIKGNIKYIILTCMVLLVTADMFRFGWKFISFSKPSWIYPQTTLISRVKKDVGYWRIQVTDRRILPPNFSVHYKLQDVSGYDPLYLTVYAQYAAAWDRGKADISPAAFNRIITPIQYTSPFADLLGVKYIFSYGELSSAKLDFVEKEGETYLYENKQVMPRAFFVEKIIPVHTDQEAIETMYKLGNDIRTTAVVEDRIIADSIKLSPSETVHIVEYLPDYIKIEAASNTIRLLLLTDIYYPSWSVFIDGEPSKMIKTDFAFRGVVVPRGNHTIEFKNKLL